MNLSWNSPTTDESSETACVDNSHDDNSRRTFLRVALGASCAGCAAIVLGGCGEKSAPGAGTPDAKTKLSLSAAEKTADGWRVRGAARLTAGAAQSFIAGGEMVFVLGMGEGKLRALSGKCTHSGCAVEWKGEKKQFFCPCHASRFDVSGKVLNGPAEKPLPEYKVVAQGDDALVSIK